MVGITESIQTGKSMDRHDNGTIQKHIHCLISDVRIDWKNSGICQFNLGENFTQVNFTYIVRTRRFLSKSYRNVSIPDCPNIDWFILALGLENQVEFSGHTIIWTYCIVPVEWSTLLGTAIKTWEELFWSIYSIHFNTT